MSNIYVRRGRVIIKEIDRERERDMHELKIGGAKGFITKI